MLARKRKDHIADMSIQEDSLNVTIDKLEKQVMECKDNLIIESEDNKLLKEKISKMEKDHQRIISKY